MGTLFNTEHVKGVLNIMSKKLLSEAEFRKFAKLANLETLAEKKIDEIYAADEEPVEEEVSFDDEETLEEEEELETEEMDLDADLGGMEEEPPVDDVPEPVDDLDAGGEVMLWTEDAQSVAAALPAMEKIAAAVGEGEDELPGEPEAEVDLDAELGGGEEEEVPMQEEESDEVELNEEDLIEVVAQRVAQRLHKEKNMEDVVSQLAERILKKLEN